MRSLQKKMWNLEKSHDSDVSAESAVTTEPPGMASEKLPLAAIAAADVAFTSATMAAPIAASPENTVTRRPSASFIDSTMSMRTELLGRTALRETSETGPRASASVVSKIDVSILT